MRMASLYLVINLGKKGQFTAQHVEIEQPRLHAIVEIGSVVGNFVDPIGQLRFHGRPPVELILGQIRKLASCVIARMLNDTFAYLKRQIETGKIEIALLELLDDAQRVQVMFEPLAKLAH